MGKSLEEDLINIVRSNAILAPDKIIVEDSVFSLSWRDLMEQAEIVASYLLAEGKSDGFVPFYASRHKESIIVILACLILGKPFVPIQKDQPLVRIEACVRSLKMNYIFDFTNGSIW